MALRNLSNGVSKLRLDALANSLRQRLRLARGVVVTDQHSPPVGDPAAVAVDDHLEVDPDRRATYLARPDVGADLLVEECRRAEVDVGLGEDEAELLAVAGRVSGDHPPDVVDPSGLEEAQELDVVHVLESVEVAPPHALHDREAAVVAHVRRSGIWIRASALT